VIGVAEPASFAEFRGVARGLLAAGVGPREVIWNNRSLFGSIVPKIAIIKSEVPRAYVALAESVSCHRGEARWPLLYRLLWRLTHGEPSLLQFESDDDVLAARAMEQAVYRDEHKMRAFVRFRVLRDADGEERYIAWHRPDHRIVRSVAPFFVERFHAMRWSILTPDACAHWDKSLLTFTPGARREDAPLDDELEDLWRDYYAAIYNPARTNLKLMQQHVPKKHWATLPELRDFQALAAKAPARVDEMVSHTSPAKRSAASYLPLVDSLAGLTSAASLCRGCDLHSQATQTVFGEGNLDAKLVFVGEQPGDQEDLAGKPFIGPAGEVFDRALADAGIARGDAYVTNAVKHFKWVPRGKKRLHQKPSAREVKACQPWLEAELLLVKPQVIVCLGATAAQSILGAHVKVSELRGKLVPTSRAPHCVVTFHPSAVLRAEDGGSIYAALVADLRMAAQCLSASP
jgi:probable DNA metabolism protein